MKIDTVLAVAILAGFTDATIRGSTYRSTTNNNVNSNSSSGNNNVVLPEFSLRNIANRFLMKIPVSSPENIKKKSDSGSSSSSDDSSDGGGASEDSMSSSSSISSSISKSSSSSSDEEEPSSSDDLSDPLHKIISLPLIDEYMDDDTQDNITEVIDIDYIDGDNSTDLDDLDAVMREFEDRNSTEMLEDDYTEDWLSNYTL